MTRVGGSFRDPEGSVYRSSGRVFRGVSESGTSRVETFISSKFYCNNAGRSIVNSWIVSPADVINAGIPREEVATRAIWIEHERLPLITYPYEWPFEYLKQAACFTLNLLAEALENGYTLKDASAYNIQFLNGNPIFIDLLSFVEYKDGDPFVGYKQFCEHFFAPLCLTSYAGIEYNQWYRGRLDGLDLVEVSKSLPFFTRFKMQVFSHIHLQAWAMEKVQISDTSKRSTPKKRRITLRNLIALINKLCKFIENLERKKSTYWQSYDANCSYDHADKKLKTYIVQEFVKNTASNGGRQLKLLDIGCNTGYYSKIAIESGAKSVIGVDLDVGALNLAVKMAKKFNMQMQFLYWDLANPSPDLGWKLKERLNLESRLEPVDFVFCFALIHHVVIGRNIPLDDFVSWVCSLAPTGIIEFIPKSDPMVQGLLQNRDDIFHSYSRENFESLLKEQVDSITVHKLQHSPRVFYEFERFSRVKHLCD